MKEKDPNTTERSMKPWIIYIVIFGAIFVLLTLNTDPKKGEEQKMDYREFKELLDANLIVEAKIKYSQATDLREISGIIAKTNSAGERILEPGSQKAKQGVRF
ncbi:MAG: ATP-dependent metallopeptidase FtsH/Yme1/Tma family protein, partial [Verrucomicrobiia bacterium]